MNILLITCSRDSLPSHFISQLSEIRPWKFVGVQGISCVTQARCQSLTIAEKHFDECDAVVMADDDMEFSAEAVNQLASAAIASKFPQSALYVDRQGKPCATPWHQTGRFLTGLGLLAFCRDLAIELRRTSVLCAQDPPIRGYTNSGPVDVGLLLQEDIKFITEDYFLTMRMGGAVLHPDLRVGHLKTAALYPSEQAIEWVKLNQKQGEQS